MGKANIKLSVIPIVDEINNPKITFSRVVTNLDTSDIFGSAYKPIPAKNIVGVDAASVPLKMGSNSFSVSVPSAIGDFAFFEFIVEGFDSDGQPFTSAVGFIPYRKLDYLLVVKVQDAGKTKELTEVMAGVPVNLNITAIKASGAPVNTDINPLVLDLGSTYDLYTVDGAKIDTMPGGLPGGKGDITVVFHKVPVGGIDQVKAAGNGGVDGAIPFLGSSGDIKILPGAPDQPEWQIQENTTVPSGEAVPALAVVYDKYRNKITGTPVALGGISTAPTIGDLMTPEATTDITGLQRSLLLLKKVIKVRSFRSLLRCLQLVKVILRP